MLTFRDVRATNVSVNTCEFYFCFAEATGRPPLSLPFKFRSNTKLDTGISLISVNDGRSTD
jgi:hypothetical protein